MNKYIKGVLWGFVALGFLAALDSLGPEPLPMSDEEIAQSAQEVKASVEAYESELIAHEKIYGK